jgi:hypothetical protein
VSTALSPDAARRDELLRLLATPILPDVDPDQPTLFPAELEGDPMSRTHHTVDGETRRVGQADSDTAGPTDGTFDPTALDRPAPPASGPDPFDPESLRLSADFGAGIGVKKVLLAVPVRKPDKGWFVRVHPDPAYRLPTAVIELKEDRETYLVDRGLWPDLVTESTFSPRALFTAVNRNGAVFVWPVRLPGPDGKVDEWSRTALDAAELAVKGWVRVAANMSLGAYDVFQATGQLPEPDWPDVPLAELLRVAFRDRHIRSLDHPVLRRLRGEV